MLRALCGTARPGGVLLLVTCSIEPAENEAVVASVLADEPRFERLDLEESELPRADEIDAANGFWRVFPAAGHDGFSVHALRRRS
jgi:16S rRNA (cytosine967-C5)-methyltransferase